MVATRRPRSMEKTDQKEVEYMMNKGLWIDTRLSEEEMTFLNKIVITSQQKSDAFNMNSKLAGNISKSEKIIDVDNWFYETVLKKLTERMFYRDWDNYYKYVIDQQEELLFELNILWVNYQKQHEFNPLHSHGGLYSFVVFMKIPTHWKEQHALPFSANSNMPTASDFAFVVGREGGEDVAEICIPLCPEDEGRMLFFPATLKHLVYPFYECEEDRVTISGNIDFAKSNKSNSGNLVSSNQIIQEVSVDVYEEKEKIIEMLENSVEVTKEELKMMKKKSEV